MSFLLPLLLQGCAPDEPAPIAWCESDVAYSYAPAEALTTFPDDHWTVADSTSSTGLRVALDPDDPALASMPEDYRNLLDQLSTLDGFGLTPALIMMFEEEPPADSEVVLLAEVDGAFVAQDFTLRLLDGGETFHVTPWRPLPPGAEVVLAVRSDSSRDDCVSPSPALRALLDPASDAPLASRYADGLQALGWEPAEVGAMVVFTTQSAEEVDVAVAADIGGRTIQASGFTCTDGGVWRGCEGAVAVGDYRGADGIVAVGAPAVESTYDLPVSVWLPPVAQAGPYGVALCGHGLGGGRSQCAFMADLAAPLGFAVMAVDAQQHGDHPARSNDGSDLDQIMALFGFTLTPPSLDALVMRDNFRASAWDKLQVLRAVQLGMDVDGDGVTDLDASRIMYVGASLGGIMGPELMAWDPAVLGAALVVPGGGLMNLVLDSVSFGIIAQLMKPDDWDDDDLARSIPMVQTLIDAGDPLVHAAAITRRRSAAEQADVVLLMAFDDQIVPNSATAALAQAFAVDGVGTALLPVDGVVFVAGPVAGNLADGATGGFAQFDFTQAAADAEWEAADHSTLHESIQAAAIIAPFLTVLAEGGTPSLADPYAGGE